MDDTLGLRAAAAFLGSLLVTELDAVTLALWSDGPSGEAIGALGIPIPSQTDLQDLAAVYFERFVGPTDGLPPVQSLWSEGRYDGDAAVAIRGLARAAGFELGEGARGAPVDHLGSILCLWSEVAEQRPDIGWRLRADHLPWGRTALAAVAEHPDFYGAVARATLGLIDALVIPATGAREGQRSTSR